MEPGSSFLSRGSFHSTYRGEITPVKPIYRAIYRGYFTPFTTIGSGPTNVVCEIYFFGAGTPTRLSGAWTEELEIGGQGQGSSVQRLAGGGGRGCRIDPSNLGSIASMVVHQLRCQGLSKDCWGARERAFQGIQAWSLMGGPWILAKWSTGIANGPTWRKTFGDYI